MLAPTSALTIPSPSLFSKLRLVLVMQRDRLGMVQWLQKNLGDLVKFELGPIRLLVVSHPTVAIDILRLPSAFGNKGLGLEEARRFLGDGLLTSATDAAWIRSRKTILPSFTRVNLDPFLKELLSETERLFLELRGCRTQNIPDISALIDRIAFHSVGYYVLGQQFAQHEAGIVREIKRATRWVDRTLSFPSTLFTSMSWRASRDVQAGTKRLFHDIDSVIAEAGVERFPWSALGDRSAVRHQICTLLVAGSETIMAATVWTLMLLAENPEVLKQVAFEGCALPAAAAVTGSDVDRLAITRAAVMESLRLFPPVWAITRRTDKAVRLNGCDIGPYTNVLINIYGIHRHEALWENPNDFKPMRFRKHSDPTPPFLPFGIGARRCVGQHFGLAAATVLVAKLTTYLRPLPIPRQRVGLAGLTLRPRDPVSGLYVDSRIAILAV